MSVRCLIFNIFYLETLFCAVRTIWGSSKTSGNLLNLVFWEERTGTEATKRFAYAPTVVKHVVKKFSEFRVVRKWWENTRFCPENAKNKAENGSFSALFGLSDKT